MIRIREIDTNSVRHTYDCKSTPIKELANQYKIECVQYTDILPYVVPKRREDATMECRTKTELGILEGSVTWAVPCNNIQECYFGEDESDCEFPFWIILSFLLATGVILCLTFFAYSRKYRRYYWNVVMQDRRWRLATQQPTSYEQEKAYRIALLVYKEDSAGIENLFKSEVETYGSTSKAICFLKVCTVSSREIEVRGGTITSEIFP